jgi:predicted AlkP superfamily phosphohydrolase/phosphomutase
MSRTAPCVLIGWDGATFDLLLPWVQEGRLPNLRALMGRGTARRLRSVIPPISPAAWVSILSGMNPGKHGILDFKEFNASDYVSTQPALVNSTHFSGTTILDVLSERGKRVCGLQLPMTYPVWPVNGLLLAGIPNPDDTQAYTYPPGRDFGLLRPAGLRRRVSYTELLENCTFHIRKLTDIFCQVVKEDYDWYGVYYRESDDFHHHYWRLLNENYAGYDREEAVQMGNPILTIYQLLDKELGRLVEAQPDANFFLISDHGGTAIGRRRFYINCWLAQHGFLELNRSLHGVFQRVASRAGSMLKPWLPRQLLLNLQNEKPTLARAAIRLRNSTGAISWEATRAFAVHLNFPTAGIQVNVRGRERHGCVQPGAEYEQVRGELICKIKSTTDPVTGLPIVKEVFRREDLCSGPYLDRIPDILVHFDTSILTRTELAPQIWGETPESDLRQLSGDHDLNGILAAAGPDVDPAGFLSDATILDVAPTMLCAMRQPVPENMDGRVLEDIFRPAFLLAHPPAYNRGREIVARAGENVYSADEEAVVRERLQSLGYLAE